MAKSFEVKKPPRRGRGGSFPSFSFLFRGKEKQKEAKRKEKPNENYKNKRLFKKPQSVDNPRG